MRSTGVPTVQRRSLVQNWRLPAAVNAAAYVPGGKFAVAASADGSAYVLALP